MGMAPYGEPRLRRPELERLLTWRTTAASGSTWTTSRSTARPGRLHAQLLELLGERAPASRSSSSGARATARSALRRLAAHVQAVTEGDLVEPRAARRTGTPARPNLCFAGGVALNSVANCRIARRDARSNDSSSSPPRATRAARWARRSGPTTSSPASRARGRTEHASWGAEYAPTRSSLPRRPRESATASSATSGSRARRSTAARRGQGRRLVPGPLRVGAARARPPHDPRRPAPRRDEGRVNAQDQVSRAVPPLRAGGAGGRRLATSGRAGPPPASPVHAPVAGSTRRGTRRSLPSPLGHREASDRSRGLNRALPPLIERWGGHGLRCC